MFCSVKIDAGSIERLGKGLTLTAAQQGYAFTAALNRSGDSAYTQVVRYLVKTTGMQSKRVRVAVVKKRATSRNKAFAIRGTDRYTTLADFNPRQRKGGVSATPWGKRRTFPGTFFIPGAGGHVFKRTGAGRLPIHQLYGPALPVELIRDQTKQLVDHVVATEFLKNMQNQLAFRINKLKADAERKG